MITVGLVKELYFIAHVTQTPVLCDIKLGGGFSPVSLTISHDGLLEAAYKGQTIWREHVEGDGSYFGIESCDTISRILACIDNGSDWTQYRWEESSLTNKQS